MGTRMKKKKVGTPTKKKKAGTPVKKEEVMIHMKRLIQKMLSKEDMMITTKFSSCQIYERHLEREGGHLERNGLLLRMQVEVKLIQKMLSKEAMKKTTKFSSSHIYWRHLGREGDHLERNGLLLKMQVDLLQDQGGNPTHLTGWGLSRNEREKRMANFTCPLIAKSRDW